MCTGGPVKYPEFHLSHKLRAVSILGKGKGVSPFTNTFIKCTWRGRRKEQLPPCCGSQDLAEAPGGSGQALRCSSERNQTPLSKVQLLSADNRWVFNCNQGS